MLFNSEPQANTAAATEVNYATQNHSRTRTAVTLLHNRSKILHLNLNALSWQSGGIAKDTSRGPGLFPCYEVAPRQSMVFVAAAKQVSMFTGVTGAMQYHGRFVKPSTGPLPVPSAFADPNSPITASSATLPGAGGQLRGPVELGIALDFTFNNPYKGSYGSFSEGTPIEWKDPSSATSPGKAPGIGPLDAYAFEAYQEMMHDGGGSFCVPLPQYAQDLVLGTSSAQTAFGASTAYLRIGYLPVSTTLMTFIIEDAVFDYRELLKPMPRPHMPKPRRNSNTTMNALFPKSDSQQAQSAGDHDRRHQVEADESLHAMSFRVVEYNCFLRPNYVSYDGQTERARRIPSVMDSYARKDDPFVDLTGTGPTSSKSRGGPEVVVHTGNKVGEDGLDEHQFGSDPKQLAEASLKLSPDVVVMAELFTLQDTIADAMSNIGLHYHTGKLSCNACVINGGVAVFSRYPIVDAKTLVFPGSASSGKDYLSAKGVVYTKIRKSVTLSCGRCVSKDLHVISAHLQAPGSSGADAARRKQIRMMRLFTRRLHLTPLDSVVYAGDFSVSMRDVDAFDSLTEGLGCFVPSFVGGVSTQTPHNDLAGRDGNTFRDDLGDWVDYVFCSREHCPPLRYLLEALSHKPQVDPEAKALGENPTTSTTDFADCDRYLKNSLVRSYRVSNSAFLQVLPDFRAPSTFTVQWNKWKNNSEHGLRDLSDHYPVFAEIEAPLFTRDWCYTAEGEFGEKEYAKDSNMYFPPNPGSPGTVDQQQHAKAADKQRFVDTGKTARDAIGSLGLEGTNEPSSPDEKQEPKQREESAHEF